MMRQANFAKLNITTQATHAMKKPAIFLGGLNNRVTFIIISKLCAGTSRNGTP
ncbi:hypothetical protein FBY13_10210 [Pantoea sp. SJZ147]|nr:hypothetical protein FBY13_10210 [Pantoea sp. SJZ147]